MKKTDETKTLSLRRETLKELSTEELRGVAGGTSGRCNDLSR
jgi:hypothetical protein